MSIAVLAAFGYRLLVAAAPPATRRIVLPFVATLLLAEYRVTLALAPYPNTPPEVYRMLAAQPRGVVLECPAPRVDALPGNDARYTYMSTFHWFPLVNGYSGIYPVSYLRRLERLREFPGETSIRQMRADGVTYIIVHASGYSDWEFSQIATHLRASGMAELGTYSDGIAPAALFRAP